MILIGIGAKSGDPVKELHYLQWDVQSCFMFHTYMLSSTKLIPPYNPVRYLMIINWKQQNSFPIVCNPASLMECDAHWFPWCYFKTQEFYPVVISKQTAKAVTNCVEDLVYWHAPLEGLRRICLQIKHKNITCYLVIGSFISDRFP